MVLNEFHYDPEMHDGGGLISVIQGAFSFVSGQAAKVEADALRIEMPTMTIGVRGTKVAGFAAAEGETSRVALLAEDDGTVGKIMVMTDAGSYLVTEANMMVESVSRYLQPLDPVVITTDVLHQHFSSALTILPPAAVKPGEGPTVPELKIDSLNDFLDCFHLNSSGVNYARFKQRLERMERRYGTFYRRFSLPDTADAEKISATGKNGVLEVAIPKKEKAQPRKITVAG